MPDASTAATLPAWVLPAIAAAGGLAGAIGAVTAQAVNGWFARTTKKVEMSYARKADAYSALLQKAGSFGLDPASDEKYAAFLTAFHTAWLLAGPDVEKYISLNGSIAECAKALRDQATLGDDAGVAEQRGKYNGALQVAIHAMRADLKAVSDTVKA